MGVVGLTTGVLLLVKDAVLVTFSVGEVTVVRVGVAPDKDKVEPVSDWLRLS